MKLSELIRLTETDAIIPSHKPISNIWDVQTASGDVLTIHAETPLVAVAVAREYESRLEAKKE
jgi:hypothetical protein